ncbi:unnamed protein product [Echinostoma caproni]|uniref:Uncharacterized protein n=1 Tax=Echinostoma caproni TaxID=27848 RepID=A0A183BFR6_9TREM|nr:unnamed protein product [Echinostoma caproni]
MLTENKRNLPPPSENPVARGRFKSTDLGGRTGRTVGSEGLGRKPKLAVGPTLLGKRTGPLEYTICELERTRP